MKAIVDRVGGSVATAVLDITDQATVVAFIEQKECGHVVVSAAQMRMSSVRHMVWAKAIRRYQETLGRVPNCMRRVDSPRWFTHVRLGVWCVADKDCGIARRHQRCLGSIGRWFKLPTKLMGVLENIARAIIYLASTGYALVQQRG